MNHSVSSSCLPRPACRWTLWDDRRMKLLRTLLCAPFFATARQAWAEADRDEAAEVAQRVASGRVGG